MINLPSGPADTMPAAYGRSVSDSSTTVQRLLRWATAAVLPSPGHPTKSAIARHLGPH